jgi:hypothetical protein
MGTKISEFSNGTLPLAGTELVPIVQGGSTVKTTVGAFTSLAPVQSVAARTGNVVLGIPDIGNLQTTLDDKLSISGGVISVNSSTDALRITQTGTGNALTVEDSANPDANPFVVDAAGGVGIGTTIPTEKLDVYGNVKINNSGFPGLIFNSTASGSWKSYAVFSSNNTRKFELGVDIGANGTNNFFVYDNVAATNRFLIDQSGNVGIGTSSVTANVKLEVAGRIQVTIDNPDVRSVTASGRGWRVGNESAGTTFGSFYIQGSSDGFVSNFVTPLYITSSGNVGIGTSAPIYALDIERSSGEAIIRARNTGTSSSWLVLQPSTSGAAIVHNPTATATYFTTNSTERLRIDAVGNVGIGTSTFGTNAVRVLAIANGTAPTTGVAGVGQLYVENGVLKYKGPTGTVTNLGAS